MSHYFKDDPRLPHERIYFRERLGAQIFQFESDRGVFSRERLDFGTRLMLEAILARSLPKAGRVLDLGCGWGAVGIVLKRTEPTLALYMADVNPRALLVAERNLAGNFNPVPEDIHLIHSDGLVAIDGKFDLICLNPPIRAGKETVYRLFQESRAALRESGTFVTVMQKKQGADSGKRELERLFGAGQVEDWARKAGFHVYAAGRGLRPEELAR